MTHGKNAGSLREKVLCMIFAFGRAKKAPRRRVWSGMND